MLDGSEALTAGSKLNGYEVLQFMGRRDPFTLAYRVRDSSGAEYEMREYFPEEFLRRVEGRLEAVSESVQTTLRWGVIEFVNEAQVLVGLHEPALPRVHAVFETNGSAYYVRSLFSGRTLAQLLESPSFGNELSAVVKVMKALGNGLAAAHKEGFLHRAICPERIGFREDGSPMLLDCGAGANAVRFKSHYLNQIVQPGYAALEDYSPTGRQGPWTDVHALAVVAYRWLSGSLPPPANARSRGQLAEPLNRLVPSIPAEIANAVEWGMALNAASRPQTLTEWLRGLEQGVASNRSQSGSFSDTSLSGVTTLPASAAGLVKAATKSDKELILQTETVAAAAKRKSPAMLLGAIAVAVVAAAGAAVLVLGGGSNDQLSEAAVEETFVEPAAAVPVPTPAPSAVTNVTPASTPTETRSSSIEDVARMMMVQQMKAAEDADKQTQIEQQRAAEAEAARKVEEEATAREAELAARLAAQEAELKAQQAASSSQSEAVNLALQQQKLREKLLAEQRAKQEAEAKAAAVAAAKAAESRQTDDKRVAEQVAKARASCRIAAPDLSVDGKLLYENAMKVPGATQVGKAVRLPEIRMQDGRYVRFEVLPDNCARLIR